MCENPKLNSVQESLKSRRRTYELPRSDSEVRVNDYNPLLLMLWKANLPITLVVMLQKLKEVTCKRSGKKLAKVRAFMAVFGALAWQFLATPCGL